ncbi:MAG: MFS transporter [Candidatus Binatia bacterium]
MTKDSSRNPALLVMASALRAALFPIPVITLFWKDEIGMSLSDIMVLQAIFGATTVLLEFPSGYVADRLGYRSALITGAAFWLLGWIAYAMGTTFPAMVVAEVILGIGLAFTSGADSALLFVSLQGNHAPAYGSWEGRVRAGAQISEAVSSAIGGWLYSLAPRLPFWSQLPVALAGLGTVVATSEVAAARKGERIAHLARAWHIIRHALVRHPRLRSAMALSVALGLSTYVAVWLIQPLMQLRGIAPAWFGPLWAAAHLWLAAVSLSSARVAGAFGLRRTLLGCCLLAGASYLGLGMSVASVGIIFYLGLMTVRGLQGPILASVLQTDAPADDRASVLSLNTLLFRLVSVIVLPPIGGLADRLGIEFVLVLLGIVAAGATVGAWLVFARAHHLTV